MPEPAGLRPGGPELLVGRAHHVLERLDDELGARRLGVRRPLRRVLGPAASGERSMITASRSVPETPSTSAWCVLANTAQRRSSRPSTTQISQSGLERSSGCAMTRPTSLRSSLSPPGDGNAVCRRWYSMLKCTSSTHTGRPSSKGTKRTFWRYRGTRSSLASTIETTSANGGGGPSKIATDAMCMCDTPSSMCRNEASSGLRRSGPIEALPSQFEVVSEPTTGQARRRMGISDRPAGSSAGGGSDPPARPTSRGTARTAPAGGSPRRPPR